MVELFLQEKMFWITAMQNYIDDACTLPHLHNKQALEVRSNGRYRLLRKNSKITWVVPEDNKTSYFCVQLQLTTKIVRYELQALAASLEVTIRIVPMRIK